MSVMLFVGWILLGAAQFTEKIISDQLKANYVSLALSGFATGIFIGELIWHFIK